MSLQSYKPCFAFLKKGSCKFGDQCRFAHDISSTAATTTASGTRTNRRSQPERGNVNHIVQFFGGYPIFPYDASASVITEFHRMCDFFGWDRGDEERDEAYDGLKVAMTKQFNGLYGEDENDVALWVALCQLIEINPVPTKLRDCRRAVKNAHVNIVDLLDTPMTGERVVKFSSEEALSAYTKRTGKYFSASMAHAGNLLKYLLRRINNPPPAGTESSRRGRSNRGRGNRSRV
ncbi:hypothetical protein PLICRDRAFT_457370 [Plicaturopsis crispa FD-325 SS-3]|nr:hypothetical protein PLICRDRAFT_457370 [Plicaturopsis crispa FD-325 SS-3]